MIKIDSLIQNVESKITCNYNPLKKKDPELVAVLITSKTNRAFCKAITQILSICL